MLDIAPETLEKFALACIDLFEIQARLSEQGSARSQEFRPKEIDDSSCFSRGYALKLTS